MNHQETTALLTFLAAIYQSLKVSQSVIESWKIALENHDAGAILTAAKWLSQRQTRFENGYPAPADLINAWNEIRPKKQPYNTHAGMQVTTRLDAGGTQRHYLQANANGLLDECERRLRTGQVPVFEPYQAHQTLRFYDMDKCHELPGDFIRFRDAEIPRWELKQKTNDKPLTLEFIQKTYDEMSEKQRELLGIKRNASGLWEAHGALKHVRIRRTPQAPQETIVTPVGQTDTVEQVSISDLI